jgi:hypothetical protein
MPGTRKICFTGIGITTNGEKKTDLGKTDIGRTGRGGTQRNTKHGFSASAQPTQPHDKQPKDLFLL